ncbi:MAG: branched-chain amino acid ABC transporter permease [Chloroflexi bacterium HGW-Chloroflexi-3]|nr:MAG: branched-chain amino acid ABC transporter permease [Chloroflexi bacterium HGW-Chloroflexi-3]
MNPIKMNDSTTNRTLNRIITPILLIVVVASVYLVVVYENVITTIAGLLLGVGVFFGYSRYPKLKESVNDGIKKDKVYLIITGLILAFIIPLTTRTQPYIIHILIIAEISIILALGLNFQVGSTGIPNLGYAAFYGVGAYASALLSTKFGMSFWVSLLAAGFIAAFFGWLVGLPTLRTRSYHMALVSIAFGLVTYIMLNNLVFTGGPNGIKNIPAPEIFGWSLFSTIRLFGNSFPVQINFYYFVLLFLVLMLAIAFFVYNSKIGLFWNAVREDEIAAKCSGINTAKLKLLSFAMGAFLAGIAGSLYAHYIGYISPENFNFNTSLQVLGMVIMGGLDNIVGVSIGAFILSVAPEKFRSLADFRMLATGLIILLMLMFRSSGIIRQQIREYKKSHFRTELANKDEGNG